MNVTLTSLEALILKATHESLPCPDGAALEAFCAVMKDSNEGPQFAAQALAARIHSSNTREALLALTMLDTCMRRCDASFQAEVGKFRFLNEMIKLVSPRYYADKTAPEVRTRILQLLHAWSVDFPTESKLRVAYDMLKNQGVVKETPVPIPPENMSVTCARAKNAIFEDEEKSKLLQKLLQSKKPEDLQHANRLIKTMVREEERRNEASSRRAQEVGAALDSAGLLRDMLAHASDASPDERQLIHELHATCARLRPALQRLASADAHANNLDEILHANDVLDEVFEKYNAFVAESKEKEKSTDKVHTPANNSDALLDFAGANVSNIKDNLEKVGQMTKVDRKKSNVIDELGDIFASENGSTNIAEPLKPLSLIPNEDSNACGEKSKFEGWNELDSLGEQLLKQSLPDNAKRTDSFNSKPTKKIPMNALEKTLSKHETPTNGAIFDLDFFTKKPEDRNKVIIAETTKPNSSNDDVMVDISDHPEKPANMSTNKLSNNNFSPKTNNSLDNILDLSSPLEDNATCDVNTPVENKECNSITEKRDNTIKNNKSDVKPLTDINVTLQSVKPSKVPPLTAFEEEGGVSVVLHFCKDKPRPDVNVIVISTTSKNSSPIDDYKFQAVVPKGCKVRLLTPSGTSLPAYNPFLPPPALTQVLLVARPAPPPQINLKYVITYTCDEEMCSEMGEVKTLPLDDI